MKKIPTLFERKFENHSVIEVLPNVTKGMEWVLNGEGEATIKIDGSCCAIINNEFYKRYDAKRGKPIPKGAIKCQEEPDQITGHLPCWVKCDRFISADKWFWAAYDNFVNTLEAYPNDNIDGTYEAIGKHFQGNPYNMEYDILVKHGQDIVDVPRSFEGIRDWLQSHKVEGIVFWKNNQPRCKIKRSDFGFEWNKGGKSNDKTTSN